MRCSRFSLLEKLWVLSSLQIMGHCCGLWWDCVSALPTCSVFYLLPCLFFSSSVDRFLWRSCPSSYHVFSEEMWFSVSLEGSEFSLFLYHHAEPDPPYFLFFDFILLKNCHICFSWLWVYLTCIVVRFWTHLHKSKY